MKCCTLPGVARFWFVRTEWGVRLRSLLARLLLVVAAAVLPSLAVQAYLEADARHTRQHFMEDEALRLVRLVAGEQQRVLEGAEQLLSGIAATPALQDADSVRCQRLLANVLREQPRYVSAAVISLDGRTICAPGPIIPTTNSSARSHFRLALQTGGFAVGDYVVGEVTHQRSLHLARPFRNRDGAIAGVVALAFSIDWLGRQLEGLALPPEASVAIMDRNGITLARHPDPQQTVGQPMPPANRFQLEGHAVGSAQLTDRDGRERIMGYSPPGADPKGLLIVVGLDRVATFASAAHADRIALLLMVCAVGLALSMTALVGWRLIRRPFNRLLNVADRWRNGDFAARTHILASNGEFGRLAAALDSMAATQQAREAALRESETRLNLAREAAGFGIWDWDLETDTVIWSDEHWLLHGLEPRPDGIIRGADDTNIHPEDRARLWAEMNAAVADPTLRLDTEYRVQHPDGQTRWLHAKGTVVHRADGKPVRMVGLVMDVTERRETEAALRRLSDDLEVRVHAEIAAREAAQARATQAERMQALGQLAGGIAHDFNNVLQAVGGAASLIERRTDIDAAVRRLARVTLEATERGASITRRLLAFGHRGDLRAEALDATALLNNLQVILVHTLGAAIEVEVKADPDCQALMADKGQLESALVNLATNARDAMPKGGRLTLAAANETVAAGAAQHPTGLLPGRYVRFSIADTGTGMDAATLKRATEPFFTTKKVGAGTGLGLPMVKGFAEQSGGALGIDSVPGVGTTVTLWLPVAEATPLEPAAPRAEAALPRRGAARGAEPDVVLVVDDEDLIRETIAEHLEDVGFRVLTARNGADALAILGGGKTVDVLVTDLAMPGMDGLAVIRAAQVQFPGLPAVLLTGYVGDGAVLAVGGAVSGSFSLLRKPVRVAHLVDRIQSLLAMRTGASL